MPESNSSGARDKAPLVSIEDKSARRAWVPLLLCALFMVAGLSLTLALPAMPRSGPWAPGMVSTHDVLAPRRATYVSRLLTEDAQMRAEAAVETVYTMDSSVARQQLTRAQQILAYAGSIRQDDHASAEDKARWISKMSDLVLPPSVVSTVVSLDDDSWQSVSSEVSYLLDRLLREGVPDDQLEEMRDRVPQLVSYTLAPAEAEVVSALVQGLLKPNRFFDAQQTAKRREQARDAVQPVQVVIEQGEAVLRQGDIVTPLHLEQLTVLGLQTSQPEIHTLLSILLFVVALVLVLSLYIWRVRREILRDRGRVILLGLLVVLTAVAAKLAMPGHVLLPYFFPMAAFAMLVSVLIDTQLSIVATFTLSLFVGFVTGGSLDLTVYVLLGSVVAALVVSSLEHLGTFAWAAIATALVNATVVLAFRLFSWGYDPVGLLQLAVASVANGVLSASLTFTSFFWLGSVFGIATPLQLMELARPTHPLTRRLLMEAPGTYHHSLIVSNLSERAAHMVGADPLLVRVAALHHDVGKVLRPYFFVENQASGENYHQQLDAKTSAEIIISHVQDSLDLARKYRFSQKVLDIMAQHHGTTSVGFGHFYREACKEADGEPVDEAGFRYPGPRPQSKEAGIVMLADSVEAAARASSPSSAGEIERIVRKIANDRLVSGELDECQLTLRDLGLIRSAFIEVLQGVSHLRIQYPEKDSMIQQPEA